MSLFEFGLVFGGQLGFSQPVPSKRDNRRSVLEKEPTDSATAFRRSAAVDDGLLAEPQPLHFHVPNNSDDLVTKKSKSRERESRAIMADKQQHNNLFDHQLRGDELRKEILLEEREEKRRAKLQQQGRLSQDHSRRWNDDIKMNSKKGVFGEPPPVPVKRKFKSNRRRPVKPWDPPRPQRRKRPPRVKKPVVGESVYSQRKMRGEHAAMKKAMEEKRFREQQNQTSFFSKKTNPTTPQADLVASPRRSTTPTSPSRNKRRDWGNLVENLVKSEVDKTLDREKAGNAAMNQDHQQRHDRTEVEMRFRKLVEFEESIRKKWSEPLSLESPLIENFYDKAFFENPVQESPTLIRSSRKPFQLGKRELRGIERSRRELLHHRAMVETPLPGTEMSQDQVVISVADRIFEDLLTEVSEEMINSCDRIAETIFETV